MDDVTDGRAWELAHLSLFYQQAPTWVEAQLTATRHRPPKTNGNDVR